MLVYIVSQFVEMYENESTKTTTLDIGTKVTLSRNLMFRISCLESFAMVL